MCTRLDNVTVAEWQLKQDTKDLPKYKDLEVFLSNRITTYEASVIATVTYSDEAVKKNTTYKVRTKKVLLADTNNNQHTQKPYKAPRYNLFAGPHRFPSCMQFDAMNMNELRDLVEKNKVCFNCLYYGLRVSKCRHSSYSKCGKRHHEKLHINSTPLNKSLSEPEKIVSLAEVLTSQNNINAGSKLINNVIILATAIVTITDINSIPQLCRAVIDSGAEISLITIACAKRL